VTFPLGETVTHHKRTPGTRNADGETWVDADKRYSNVAVYPRVSVELVQGQDTNIIGLTAVFQPAIPVAATDEFTVRGERWAVDGLPGQYVSPFTGRELTQVHLTRVEG
jgi:hypothetical protein